MKVGIIYEKYSAQIMPQVAYNKSNNYVYYLIIFDLVLYFTSGAAPVAHVPGDSPERCVGIARAATL